MIRYKNIIIIGILAPKAPVSEDVVVDVGNVDVDLDVDVDDVVDEEVSE